MGSVCWRGLHEGDHCRRYRFWEMHEVMIWFPHGQSITEYRSFMVNKIPCCVDICQKLSMINSIGINPNIEIYIQNLVSFAWLKPMKWIRHCVWPQRVLMVAFLGIQIYGSAWGRYGRLSVGHPRFTILLVWQPRLSHAWQYSVLIVTWSITTYLLMGRMNDWRWLSPKSDRTILAKEMHLPV